MQWHLVHQSRQASVVCHTACETLAPHKAVIVQGGVIIYHFFALQPIPLDCLCAILGVVISLCTRSQLVTIVKGDQRPPPMKCTRTNQAHAAALHHSAIAM